MSRYFALVNADNVVEDVAVGDDNFIAERQAPVGKQWVETVMDGAGGKNYASIGGTYDAGMGDFIPPKPFPSWTQSGNHWAAPVAKPDGNWFWVESTLSWVAGDPNVH